VKELVCGTARSHPDVLREPPPAAFSIGFGDSGLTFDLRVWNEPVRAIRCHPERAGGVRVRGAHRGEDRSHHRREHDGRLTHTEPSHRHRATSAARFLWSFLSVPNRSKRDDAHKEDVMVHDEAARVAFWVEYMEQSYALTEAIMRHPLQESREGFASIRAAAEAAGVEVRFSTTQLAGTFERLFVIRESLIPDLMAIARDMNARGWLLKIEDGYRTREMQTALGRAPAVFDRILQSCIRECGGRRPAVELVSRRAMVWSPTCRSPAPIWRSRGGHLGTRRADGAEVWRGKPYLEMSEYTPMNSPFVSAEERHNRQEITRVMERHGFLHYPGEFWHYNKGDRCTDPGADGPTRTVRTGGLGFRDQPRDAVRGSVGRADPSGNPRVAGPAIPGAPRHP